MLKVFFKRLYWQTYRLPLGEVAFALLWVPVVWGLLYALAVWGDHLRRRRSGGLVLDESSSGWVRWLFFKPVGLERIFRVMAMALCLGSVGVILWLTVLGRSTSHRLVFWVPFHLLVEARHEPELYRSMVMNVFVFMPLGLALPFVLPSRVRRRVLWAVFAACGLSLCVELLQYLCHVGVFDVDDVLTNSLGAWMGSWSWWLGRGLTRRTRKASSSAAPGA